MSAAIVGLMFGTLVGWWARLIWVGYRADYHSARDRKKREQEHARQVHDFYHIQTRYF